MTLILLDILPLNSFEENLSSGYWDPEEEDWNRPFENDSSAPPPMGKYEFPQQGHTFPRFAPAPLPPSEANSKILQSQIQPQPALPSNEQEEKTKKTKRTREFNLLELIRNQKRYRVKAINSDSDSYENFRNRFSYTYTPDQLTAIQEITNDLKSGKLMYRLLFGDVGFGKTEVACHAAWQVAKNGKKVLLMVPRKELARQHTKNLKERFEGTGINVIYVPSKSESGFSTKERQRINDSLASSDDHSIYVGTTTLVSNRTIQNLGLIIVDEEQKFGVKQKEKLRALYAGSHVLWMTATAIPRTFEMTLDTDGKQLMAVSRLTTAPEGRLQVKSHTITSEDDVFEKIRSEFARNGNVYFVVPQIEASNKGLGVEYYVDLLSNQLGRENVLSAHGRIDWKENLEKFRTTTGKVLVATTVIEVGIDIPHANTMVVIQPSRFGFSQLHQLRGRIGRTNIQGHFYAYSPLENNEMGNAKVSLLLQTLSIGGGAEVSMLDHQLRGAGALNSTNQSGKISSQSRAELFRLAGINGAENEDGYEEIIREGHVQ